jgi:hypothetical protein
MPDLDVSELTYTLRANAEAINLLRERELGAREIQDVQEAFIALCAVLGRKDIENA